MQGWIKLFRKIVNHWLYFAEPFDKFHAFIDLLILCNHSNSKIMFDGELIELKSGEMMSSVRKLCVRWKWSNTKVKRFLDALETDGMIAVKSDSRKTVIKVLNYGKYQGSSFDKNDTETTLKRHKNGTETTLKHTIKNVNNNIYNDNNVVEVALHYDNIGTLKEVYPNLDWDSYDEEDFTLKPANFYTGQKVVFLSSVQEDILLDTLGADTTQYYVGKLADYIIKKNATVKNHYATILKWHNQDTGI